MFTEWTLCGHSNTRLLFGSSFDYVVDLVDFFHSNGGKSFLDLDYI